MASPQFVFNPAVPQSAQKINATQAPILSNFQSINELVNINHIGFSDVVNYGKHTFTTFPIQGSLPTTSAAQMNLYAAAATTANGIELFYQYPSGGSRVQLTGNPSSNGTGDASSAGWAYLVGNIILKWGTIPSGTPSPSSTITYPTGGSIPPFTTTVYNVLLSVQGSNSVYFVNNLTTTNFKFNNSGTTPRNIYWYAIGV